MIIQSPCINVCKMDEASGLCSGCFRTIDEIERWSVMQEDDRRRVMQALPSRRAQSVTLLPVVADHSSKRTLK
jgi:predicted Fe-S protein YdhL (DUF1289 family)